MQVNPRNWPIGGWFKTSLSARDVTSSGVKSIIKLYLSKSVATDGKTTPSKVESID